MSRIVAAWHLLAAHPVALALAVLWLSLNVVIAIAAYRNAFDADRSEQEIEAAVRALTLDVYAKRAIPEVPNTRTAGTPGEELPTAQTNLNGGI